jgi:hypothetical protein
MALLTTAEVAAELAMSEDWVRENAVELGGIRMGRSCRAQLRFEPDRIAAYKRRQSLEALVSQAKKPQRPGRRAAPTGVELLPLPAGN